MRRSGQSPDLKIYFQAFPIYARNLGVLLPPLIAAAVGIGLDYATAPLFAPIGGAGGGIVNLIVQVILGFAFAISVIFADDAWRHNRASLSAAWSTARRKAGDILITVIGFFFLVYVAQLIGGIIVSALRIPYIDLALAALAVWAFIYSIPAVAMGGMPASGSFSASLQTARRNALPTAILAIVSLAVYYYVALILPLQIGAYLGTGFYGAGSFVVRILMEAFALGYIALVVARQYADFAFRMPW